MKTRHPLPLALWLPALAVSVALVASFLVFVWPTSYRYDGSPYIRVNRFTGRVTYQPSPGQPWQEATGTDIVITGSSEQKP